MPEQDPGRQQSEGASPMELLHWQPAGQPAASRGEAIRVGKDRATPVAPWEHLPRPSNAGK